MRKFLIGLLLRKGEEVIDSGSRRFDLAYYEATRNAYEDTYRRLNAHRAYCDCNDIDFAEVEADCCPTYRVIATNLLNEEGAVP